MNKILAFLKSLVSMSDHIDYENASISIRENVYFRGPNVFILACAIVIASVGLNVNSIPVIIGAMLISPVMGPIIGFGFGLATLDDRLVRDSLKNFGIMVGISIVASILYFAITPLKMENPTELLARTNPTLYDVLIALFGGLAGVLEISRKKKGTVLSGVAIATALMPPLCTIGYGFSVLNFRFVLGALYLFIINGIFIALATYVGVKYLKYPVVGSLSTEVGARKMSTRGVAVVLVILIVPSIISAVQIVKENNLRTHVSKVVSENKSIGSSFIYDYKVDESARPATVTLYIAGEELSDDQKELLYDRAEKYGILRSQISLVQDAAIARQDQSEIVKSLVARTEEQIGVLNDSIVRLNYIIGEMMSSQLPSATVSAICTELSAQYPGVLSLSLARGESADPAAGAGVGAGSGASTGTGAGARTVAAAPSECWIAIIKSDSVFSDEDQSRIRRYLCARLSVPDLRVIFE